MSKRNNNADQIRRQVLGDNYVNNTLNGWEPARPVLELLSDASFWYRCSGDSVLSCSG